MPKLADLLEQRASAVTEMRALTDTAEAETRDLSADEDTRFKELKKTVAGLDRKIERARDLAEAERTAPAVLHNGRGDGNYEERAAQFSVVKAIRAHIGEDVDAGFEREISAEVKRRTGRTFKGIAVPDQVFHERRTITVGDQAADLYPTQHRPDLFIDRLRASLIVGRLGATVLDGLVGDNDIPRQTASATAQWVTEDNALTGTDGDFDDVTLSPKTVGAVTSYSRRTLINASPSIEQIVRNDLAQVVAGAIDTAALFGDGMSGVPAGVRHQTGAQAVTLATPSWAEVLGFISAIEMADADVGSLGWAMNGNAVAKLRSTLKESGDAGAGYLMDTPTECAGYPVARASTIPGSGGSPAVAATVLFGAWSQLLVGYWSGVDILPNPYESTAYHRGRVLIRAMRDCDVQVRHGEAFAYAEDLTV